MCEIVRSIEKHLNVHIESTELWGDKHKVVIQYNVDVKTIFGYIRISDYTFADLDQLHIMPEVIQKLITTVEEKVANRCKQLEKLYDIIRGEAEKREMPIVYG